MAKAEAVPFKSDVDFRELLRRYMHHVRECEGITFVDRLNCDVGSDVRFTPDEVAILTEIEDRLPS